VGVHYQHLQAVFDIGETYVRLVIKRQYHNVGVLLLDPFDNPPAANVVGKAAEGLEYHKGSYAFFGIV
jgi:hypothetical protein